MAAVADALVLFSWNRCVDVIDPNWAIWIEYLLDLRSFVFQCIRRGYCVSIKSEAWCSCSVVHNEQNIPQTIGPCCVCVSVMPTAKNLTIWWKIKYKSWIRCSCCHQCFVLPCFAATANCEWFVHSYGPSFSAQTYQFTHHCARMQRRTNPSPFSILSASVEAQRMAQKA